MRNKTTGYNIQSKTIKPFFIILLVINLVLGDIFPTVFRDFSQLT